MEDCRYGRLHFISGDNKGRYPFCHSLYIEGDTMCVVVDPASSKEKLGSLRDTKAIDAVWLTHWHEDHFKYLHLFDDRPLWISERDFAPLRDMGVLLDWCGIEVDGYREYWSQTINNNFHYHPRENANFLKDGDVVDCGAVTVEVIAAPGHTPGHLCFFFREEQILFLGDYDLTPFGPWYGDLYSDIDETIASLRRLQEIHAKTWIVSHEKGIFQENPGEIWQRYENIIYERDAKILEFLNKPRTIDEIASLWIFFGKPREPMIFYASNERALLKKHLVRLEKQKRIVFHEGLYVLAD